MLEIWDDNMRREVLVGIWHVEMIVPATERRPSVVRLSSGYEVVTNIGGYQRVAEALKRRAIVPVT